MRADFYRIRVHDMNSKEALRRLKDIIGEEAYRQVLKEMAGTTVYFPAASSGAEWIDKEQRNMRLKEDFARKYELSISRVYKIIQGKA